MEADQTQLSEIEEFAAAYLTKKEIVLVTGIADASVLDDEDTPEGRAFLKGRIRRKAQFHKSITTLSDQLSSPAQAIEAKLAEKIALEDKRSWS